MGARFAEESRWRRAEGERESEAAGLENARGRKRLRSVEEMRQRERRERIRTAGGSERGGS